MICTVGASVNRYMYIVGLAYRFVELVKLHHFNALYKVARNVPTCSQKFQSILESLFLSFFKLIFIAITSSVGGADFIVACD